MSTTTWVVLGVAAFLLLQDKKGPATTPASSPGQGYVPPAGAGGSDNLGYWISQSLGAVASGIAGAIKGGSSSGPTPPPAPPYIAQL